MGIHVAATRGRRGRRLKPRVLRPRLSRFTQDARARALRARGNARYRCSARGMNQPCKIDLDKLGRLRASA